MLTSLSPRFGAKLTSEARGKYLSSSQYYDGIFRNYVKTDVMKSDGNSLKSMLDFFLADNGRVPEGPVPVIPLSSDFRSETHDALRAAWLGHSTVLLEVDGLVILTDPMLGERASPFPYAGPKRFDVTHSITVSDLPDVIDAVVISHDHYDHLDYETIVGIKDRVGRFFVPLGVGAHLECWGVSSDVITELDWWDEYRYRGVMFASTPSRHFSGRGIGRNRTLWCSWVVVGESHRVFFSGDSGYFDRFKRIGDEYGPFDLTMIECGAYNDNWPHIHMMPEETVQAHIDLEGRILMPVHWAQFNLSLHGWTEPVERLITVATVRQVAYSTPRIGAIFPIPSGISTNHWWGDIPITAR